MDESDQFLYRYRGGFILNATLAKWAFKTFTPEPFYLPKVCNAGYTIRMRVANATLFFEDAAFLLI